MNDTDLVSIKAHPMALDVIRDCLTQCQAIEQAWRDTDYAFKAYRSLTEVLSRFFTGQGFGPEEIYRDDTLSLFTRTESGFVFGTIFHRTHRPDPPQEGDLQYGWMKAPMLGRYCMAFVDGEHRYCFEPVVNGVPICGHVEPPIGVMPVPGTWSNHS